MSVQQTTRFHRMKYSRLTATAMLLALIATVVALLAMVINARALTPVRIGVLAHKGTDICRKMWQPTIDYLGEALPGRQFDLLPLQFEEVESAVRNKSKDTFERCKNAVKF